MKKFLTTLLTVVLTATLAIGGTMAYLTQDAGDEKNVFSVGNIDVSLDEEVGVFGEGGEVKETEDGAEYTEIMPGDYLQKEVTVTNNGKTDAYVAVTVDVNNFSMIRKAIESYGEDNAVAETMLEFVFDGWGLTVRDRYVDGKKDMSYKVKKIMDSHILHVDSAKRIVANDVAHFSIENWFKSDAEKNSESYTVAGVGKSYYAGTMEDYSLRFTYYIYLPAGESATLFNGLNVPAEFNADQLAMFNGLKINVAAKAIQADNMGIADIYKDDPNGEAKTAFAVLAGDISAGDLDVNNKPNTVKVEGTDKTAVVAAIDTAEPGDIVKLTGNTTIAGSGATDKLVIEKAITLDLNGYTLTTESGWGGIDAKGGCSIKNGTINHTGNTAAIKAFAVDKIENVTINVTATDGKTKGGIVVQNNAGNYVNTIKNVTINGATNGIECYRSTTNPAIGTIEKVKIDATDNGIWLNGAGIIGKISNSEIKGGKIGINAYLANLWNISLNIENSEISGGVSGIDIWDEDATNTGSTVTLDYDDATIFVGDTNNIKVTLGEEITCTINGVEQ